MATVDVRPLDSSVISTIGDRAGDPMGSVAKAYSLANMVDQNQMNKLALSQAEEDRAKQEDIERIVKAGKYDTAQGYWDTGAALTKAGHPEAAQSFLKLGSDVSTGKYDQQIQKLDLAARNQDVIAGAFDNIVSKVTALQNAPGKPPSDDTLNALTRTMAIADANDLKKNHPELAAQVDQFLKNPANLTYSGIMELERKSNVGQQLLAQTRASLQLSANLAKDRATTAETEARTKAIREGGKLVVTIGDDGKPVYTPISQAAGKQAGRAGAGTAGLTPEGSNILSEAVLEGVSLPTGGSRSAPIMASIFNNLAKQHPDLSPQQVVAKIKSGEINMKGLVAETGAVGRRQAGIETSAEEARNVIPIALKASADIPRGQFVPLNKLIQAGQIATSDPKLAAFAQANLTLANVYARAMSPTGTPTVEGREEALKKLSVATSPESYKAVVGVIVQEINAARSAPAAIASDIQQRTVGGPTAGQQPPLTAGGTPAANAGASFATEADAQAAAAAGKLKSGDRITVGGVSGTWQ